MEIQDHILELAVKKITGEANIEEIQQLEGLLRENPEALITLQLLFEEWLTDEQISKADNPHFLAKMMARLGYPLNRRNRYFGASNHQWQRPWLKLVNVLKLL